LSKAKTNVDLEGKPGKRDDGKRRKEEYGRIMKEGTELVFIRGGKEREGGQKGVVKGGGPRGAQGERRETT